MSTPVADATRDDSAEAPPPRSPLSRYVLIHPVSVALAVSVVITGAAFGTLWGQFPQELAAGLVTTGDLGYWWTPVTALLVPDSAIGAALTIAVVLTVLAYTERLLGSWRTLGAFFGTGVAGVLIGVGLQALAFSWGETWGQTASVDLVLDPAIGVFGTIMAGSALAPGLFRRRIRLIGFAVLTMFALYDGDADAVYRVLAALVGLALGLVFARGTKPATWHRSSYRETRTLVAAVVAVTGLGPLIVLITGVGDGPLSLVVSGFIPVDLTDALARCQEDFSAQCDSDIALALTGGVGPFLHSLIPLVLSLVAAWGLRTGRRAAWVLALFVNASMALLTAISIGTIQLLDDGVIDVIGGEFAVWVSVAVLVPVAVFVMLLITWRRFQVRAPRPAVVRFTAVVAAAAVALALLWVIVALVTAPRFLLPVTSLDILVSTLRRFIPPGFIVHTAASVYPVGGVELITYQWVGVVFWAVFIAALLWLYRATPAGGGSAAETRFRALLKQGGGGTLGFMGTWPGNDYWFSDDARGAVAYRVINGVALTMSDPVAPDGDDEAVIRGFVDFCDRQGWSPVFYSFHERYLPVFQSFGWQYMSVGEETVLHLSSFELAGKPWQKVRQALNKGVRAGMTTVWATWDELSAADAAQIDAISEQWVAEKELPEMGFTLGGVEELKDPDVYLYLAVDPEGRIEAITSWLPSWTDGRVTGWTIDFMRRGDNAMNGIMEFVIASAALHMKDLGAEILSLSGAPLATKPLAPGEQPPQPSVMTRLLGWLGGVLEPAYGFTSLFRFKSKFNPQYATIYMAYADPANLPNIGLAIGKAYLPEVSTREYLALARTLTSHRE